MKIKLLDLIGNRNINGKLRCDYFSQRVCNLTLGEKEQQQNTLSWNNNEIQGQCDKGHKSSTDHYIFFYLKS